MTAGVVMAVAAASLNLVVVGSWVMDGHLVMAGSHYVLAIACCLAALWCEL